MSNESQGPIQVMSNDVFAINDALQQIQRRLDDLKGLSGVASIKDRLEVGTAEQTGEAATLGQLRALEISDGTQSAPALSFVDDPDTGLFRIAANNGGMVAGGTLALDWNGTRILIPVALTVGGNATLQGSLELDGDLNHDGTNLGVLGATPVPRPTAYTQTYATATRTHANATAQDFTDNSGGTPADTIAAITGGGASCENATKDAIASLARQSDRLLVDLLNLKQVVNQMLDDLQAYGFLA